MSFDENKFADFIIENNVIGFFDNPVILKSGQKSNWYVNWRTPASDAYLMDKITDFVIEFIKGKGLKPDCILGVPEGATKLGVLSQFKWAKSQPDFSDKSKSYSLPMIRKSPKDHGDPADKYFVGAPVGNVILVEDVTTSGISLFEALDYLLNKGLGIKVIAAISLTDRRSKRYDNQSVADVLKGHGVPFYSLSNAVKLLPKVFAKLQKGKGKDHSGELGILAKAVELELSSNNLEKVKL